MTKEYLEAISHKSLVEMAVILAQKDEIHHEILKEISERTCGWTLDEQTCGYVTFNTECGIEFMFQSELKHYNFCPKCGSKIDSKELEEIKNDT